MLIAFAAIAWYLFVILCIFGFFAGFIWGLVEWVYDAWFAKESESNDWCSILAEEVAAEKAAQATKSLSRNPL